MITPTGKVIRHDIHDYLPYVHEPASHNVCTSPGFGWDSGLPAAGSGGDADLVAESHENPEIPLAKPGEKKWARTDTNAKQFRVTKAGGPDWDLVTRRMTTDSNTGEIIEDIFVKDAPEDFDWYAPLSKPTSTTTILWYREPTMEEQAQRRIDDAADAVKQMRVSQLPDPMSIQHLMTHLPKHPDCPECQKAKLKQAHCRRVPPERKNKITEFGQELSADTLLSKNEASTSLEGDKFAIIFHDEGTGWLE